MGIFRVAEFEPDEDGRGQLVFGDSFYAAVEFSTPIRVRALLADGNAAQSHSRHRGDQLGLLARKEMRPVWKIRSEVEAHLEYQVVL